MFKKNQEVLSYVFFFLGIVVLGVYFAGIIPENTMLIVLGILGFAGVGALRDFVDSHGWKTWFSALMGIIGVLLNVFGVVPPDFLAKWLTFWGLLAGVGLTHAVKKANNG